jgi:hypothetical protein
LFFGREEAILLEKRGLARRKNPLRYQDPWDKYTNWYRDPWAKFVSNGLMLFFGREEAILLEKRGLARRKNPLRLLQRTYITVVMDMDCVAYNLLSG